MDHKTNSFRRELSKGTCVIQKGVWQRFIQSSDQIMYDQKCDEINKDVQIRELRMGKKYFEAC